MGLRDRLKRATAAFLNAGSTPFGTGSNGIGSNATFFSLKQLQEMRPYERRECVKNSRLIDNQLGICGALNDGSIRYAIGSGINDYANTGDPDFDASANRFMESIWTSNNFDITEEQNWYELQHVIGRSILVDGDLGIAKILNRDNFNRIIGNPQIQLFTTDQIGDGDGKGLWNGETMLEGVARDHVGKATRYRILKNSGIGSGSQWDYQKKDFLLVMDRKRVALNRGMPWCHRAQRNGFSMMELSALEEAAAYVNALFAAIITTPTGESPEALEAYLLQYLTGTTTQANDGTPEQKQVAQKFVEMYGGAKVPVFPQGTKLEAYQSNRPSSTFNGHMDYLVHLLAGSYGVPANFIWAIAGRSGPETRMTLVQAQWYFNFIVMLMIRRCIKPIRDWVLLYGILSGKVNDGKPPKNGAHYTLARFHGPRDITIDERYFHKTYLERLAAGEGTSEEYHSLQGQNGRDQNFRRIDEIAETKAYCKQRDVEYMGEFIRTQPGQYTGAKNETEEDPDTKEKQEKVLESV